MGHLFNKISSWIVSHSYVLELERKIWSLEAPQGCYWAKIWPWLLFWGEKWYKIALSEAFVSLISYFLISSSFLIMGQRARNTKRVQGGSPRTGIGKTIEKNGIFSLEMVQSCFSLKWHLGPFSSPIAARDAHHGPFLQSYRCSIYHRSSNNHICS